MTHHQLICRKDIIVQLFEETILHSNQTKIGGWTRFWNLVRNLIFLLLIALKFPNCQSLDHHQLSNFWLLHNYADEKWDKKLLHWLKTWDTNVGDDIYHFVSNNIFRKSLYFSSVQMLRLFLQKSQYYVPYVLTKSISKKSPRIKNTFQTFSIYSFLHRVAFIVVSWHSGWEEVDKERENGRKNFTYKGKKWRFCIK